jgi:hypothetical protein
MDYIVSGSGASRTICAHSPRAKERSPFVLTFPNNNDAFQFITKGVEDGFRFSGRELVDRSYRLVKYGYFVRLPDGRTVFSGQDWGPPDPVFEPGDKYPGGPRNGIEAFVLEVMTGDEARVYALDVLIILEERSVADAVTIDSATRSQAPTARLHRLEEITREDEMRTSLYGSIRPQVSMEFQGNRFVAVGGMLHYSKDWHFFTDFLRDYVPAVFGGDWWTAELEKKEHDRHVVVQWRTEGIRYMNAQPSQPDGTCCAVPNGFLGAYLTFAYDLYTLEHNGGLDQEVLRRLKIADQFQGARHEIFAAATCLRAGFTIEMENERDGKDRHVEFTAKYKETGELISVEAKSKHRPGILGRPGVPPAPEKLSLRFGELINDALKKNPPHPLVVFIDTNLPLRAADRLYAFRQVSPLIPSRLMAGLIVRVRKEHGGIDPYAMLVFTNHPHHYAAAIELDQRRHLLSVMPTGGLTSRAPSPAILALHKAANLYGNIPSFFPAMP